MAERVGAPGTTDPLGENAHALTPPRGTVVAPSLPPRTLLAAGALCLVAAAIFWGPLLLGGSLAEGDWKSHHFHYFEWLRTSLVRYHTLPLYMADAWVTPNFLGNAESPILGPLVPLLFALSTGAYLKLLIVVFTAAGLFGMFLLMRDLGAGPLVAAACAALFAQNGFFASHIAIGHHWAMGVELLPGMLALYRRAALGSARALWLAALLNALTIGGGQHQAFVWQNLVLSFFALFWAVRVRDAFPLLRWLLVVAASAGLGAVKLLPMWSEFADYAPTARIQGLPLGALLWSLVAPGQGPETSNAGITFAHGAGWWEYAFYLGGVGLALLVAGAAATRRSVAALLVAALFFALCLDWGASLGFLDPWPLLSELPVWRTQRGPSRLLLPALFGLIVAAGVGLERLDAAARRRFGSRAKAFAAVLVVAIGVDLFVQSLPWQRAALGEPLATRDHRPRPRDLRGSGGVSAVLSGFSPNRLVYRVSAPREGALVLPLRYGKPDLEWDVAADGVELSPRAWRGKLALGLPPGEYDVALRYRPRHLGLGLAVSSLTLVVWFGDALRRSRRRR